MIHVPDTAAGVVALHGHASIEWFEQAQAKMTGEAEDLDSFYSSRNEKPASEIRCLANEDRAFHGNGERQANVGVQASLGTFRKRSDLHG